MKRASIISIIILFVFVASAILLEGCKKDKDSSSDESLCHYIHASYNSISIINPKSNCHGNFSNDVFNEYGQILSFDFTIGCGSTTYTGSVYNITYNMAGDIASYDATFNGEQCHWEE